MISRHYMISHDVKTHLLMLPWNCQPSAGSPSREGFYHMEAMICVMSNEMWVRSDGGGSRNAPKWAASGMRICRVSWSPAPLCMLLAGGSSNGHQRPWLFYSSFAHGWIEVQPVWGHVSGSKPPQELGHFWSAPKGVRASCGPVALVDSQHGDHPRTASTWGVLQPKFAEILFRISNPFWSDNLFWPLWISKFSQGERFDWKIF